MIRLLVYIALLIAVALGFAWLADRPGEVTLVWQGQRVETDLTTVVVGLIALIVAVVIVLWIIVAVLKTPGAIGTFFVRRRRERGWRALSQGMIAAGAGDPTTTTRLATEARKILGDEPLAMLLQAQSAQLVGNRTAAREAFEDMLQSPETRLLGLRGLFIEAQRYGEMAAARHFASEANIAAPKVAWAGQALMEFQAQARDWVGALETLDRNTRNKVIDRVQSKRLRAVLMTGRGLDIEQGEPELARALAIEAHSLGPDLVPAAVLAGRLLTRNGDIKRSARVLEATWKLAPHPDVADAYARVRPGDSTLDRLNRVKDLIRVRAHHAECSFAVAAAALDAKDYKAAREAMKPLLAMGPTRRACLLMADIEEAEHNDEGRIREWLSRAVRAPRDATWVADGFVSDHWAPVSPVSGRIDAFEWKVPPEDVSTLPIALPETPTEPTSPKLMSEIEPPKSVAEPQQRETPVPVTPAQDSAKTANVVPLPTATPAKTLPAAVPSPATGPAGPTTTATPTASGATGGSTTSGPADSAASTATAAPTAKSQRTSRPVAFALDHAPDDPGPNEAQASMDDSRADSRFRLFN
jgi:HemY protein